MSGDEFSGFGRNFMFADEKCQKRLAFRAETWETTYIGSRLNGAGNDTGAVSLDSGVGADNSRRGLDNTVIK